MKAYVFLQTKPGTSKEVPQYLAKLAKVEGVTQVDSVYGRFDVIITIEAPDLERLGEVVYEVIERIPNVTRTETAVVLSEHSK